MHVFIRDALSHMLAPVLSLESMEQCSSRTGGREVGEGGEGGK